MGTNKKIGRPSKLTDEVIQKSHEYIDHGYISRGDMIPSHAGLACVLNVNKTTLYQWAKDQPNRFSNILQKCNKEQERLLLGNGLAGVFNAQITKLVLGKHGYHERQEVTGAGGAPIKTENKVITKEMEPDEASAIYRDMLGDSDTSED